MQVQKEVKIYHYDGPRDAVNKIRHTEGIIGLYRVFIYLSRLLEQL